MSTSILSVRRRQVNPRKVYPVDTALGPLFDRSGKTNPGHALETVVLHELQQAGAEVGYVRTAMGYVRTANDYEMNFHARMPDGSEYLLQVCAD